VLDLVQKQSWIHHWRRKLTALVLAYAPIYICAYLGRS